MVVASTPGISEWANHGAHTFRKFAPVSLTMLVSCSIRQTYQILFRIFGITGTSGCFHNAAQIDCTFCHGPETQLIFNGNP
ncbi:hypothetical protein FKM82_021361 [Ascaphus truei]